MLKYIEICWTQLESDVFSMCTSEFFAFKATWSPSRCHCDLSSAASTFGQGWVKCADGELQKSESQAALGISESQSLLALYVAYCFTFFLGQPLNRRSSAIYIQCSMRFSCWSVYKPSLPEKDLERFESDDVQAMLSEDVREIRPMIMMFRCSRKAMGHGGSWTMGCQKGRPSLLPCKTFEDLWSTSWILMVPPLGTKAMQLPRDALLQPMAGVWDGSLISCAPPSRKQRRREVMVCKCLQVKETKMTKITVVVSFHMLSHALRFFSFSIDLSCKRIGVAWLRFRIICRRSASPADSCTGHHLRPCNLGCMKLMKSTTILYALSQQACFETYWNVFQKCSMVTSTPKSICVHS